MATEKPQQSVSNALSEAQTIIEAAKRRSAEIDADAERVRSQAHERGFEEGFAQGLREASEAAVRLIKEGSTIQERLALEAARLGVAIATNIIGEQIKVSPDIVAQIARRALQESIVSEKVILIVHPNDEAVLAGIRDELKKLSGGSTVVIESDAGLSRGGCIVKTDFGEVDATVEALVECVAAQLGIRKEGV